MLLAPVLLALVACSDLLIEPYEYGEVEVAAVTRAGAPLAGVPFVLYQGTRHLGYESTGEDGLARFRFVPEGALGVALGAGTFVPADTLAPTYVEFRLREGERRTERFTLLGPGTLRVRVEDPLGAPVVGVRVEVYRWTGPVAYAMTESAAPVVFGGLAAGDYGVRVTATDACAVSAAGFVYRDEITVVEDDVLDVTLAVERC